MKEKNQIFEIKIEDIAEDGNGIGKYDGYPFFVKDAVPGDRVRVSVMKDKKTYCYARILEIIEPSPDRVSPMCEAAGPCGGCQLQALSYDAQLRFKQKKVEDALSRIGKIDVKVEPIIGAECISHYRNKSEYPVRCGKDGEIKIGFYARHSHSVIECDSCIIGQESDKEILSLIKSWMIENGIRPYDEESGRGLLRHILIRTSQIGDILVCLVINAKKLPAAEKLTIGLGKIESIKSLSYCINTAKTNVIMGSEVVLLSGESYIEDTIGDVRYRISPQSFYQVNPAQTRKLYETALEYAGLCGNEVVWDMYCGIGTISLFLAKCAKMVYGVEIVPAAIRDAKENARINGISNVKFICGKAEEAMIDEAPDVVVVDPPRKGCDEALINTILEKSPSRVVYVSCNPATLARDVKKLAEGGYEVMKVQPVDMFAMSVHVETVVLMSRNPSP